VSAGMSELMFAQLLWIGCTLQIVQAACTEQTAGQSATTKCKTNMCNVLIGGTGDENKYCSQCSLGTDHLVDGKCVDASTDSTNNCVNTNNGGICESCAANYFMYQGGCYSTDASKPGHALCTTAPAGVCTAAAAGYFIPPGATKTDQSVVACGDATTGVTVSGKKYKGVENCASCTAPASISGEASKTEAAATCTACSSDKIVKTETTGTSCVDKTACNNGFFVDTTANPNKCTACADDNCDVCAASGANKCSKCKTSGDKIYLQKEADSQTGTCVNKAGCTGTNYIDETAKTCSACASAGTTDCTTCEKIESGVVCKECTGGTTIFGLNKKSCVSQCPENSSKQIDTCVCNDGFTPSTGSSACVATSRSVNLSTGAIAGISVAAVVVVGGLVGFLCWWFVCRGKA
ncbi:Variant-specific surface protein, partial [Giardia duodenalis]